ncbi:MAG TPA: benzoate-CoA ligase family protein [Rubrobacteraceae bacterium]|nr:benzoate-CoA ligase family protein [Rubrobacteraceae bacterium]
MERARVNGTELEYEIAGEGEPVLLIHGSHIGGSFIPLMTQPALTGEYRLIRYHRRGFLGSMPASGPMSIKDQAEDSRALLEYLGARPAHVVAHSYGGPIGLQLARDFPEYVRSLALLEPAVLSVPRAHAVHDLVDLATSHYRQGNWEAAEDFFLGSPRERSDISRNVPGGLEQALADMDTFFDVEAPAHEEWRFGAAEASKIEHPTLYVLGGESSPFYVEILDALREWMPQTEAVILPEASHLLHIQDPEGAAVLLRNFFARHPLPAARRSAEAEKAQRLRPSGFYNAASDLLDGNLERGLSDEAAIRTHGGAWSYADVASGANRVGNALRGLGVEMENRVLVALPDSPEFATTFFGAIKAGAVPVPASTALRPAEYAYLLADSRAKVAVVSEPIAAALREARRGVRSLRHIVVVGQPGAGELGFEEIVRGSENELAPANTTRDDACFWLYTSGRAGRPKCVPHLQHDMRFCADTYARHVLAITEDDVTFSVSKLYWAYGLGGGLYFPFSAGATTVLLAEPPQPRVVLNAMQEFEPTIFFGVPTSYAGLLAASPSTWKRADLSPVRMCVSSGEALSGSLLERWKEKTSLEIVEGIGSTESCHIFISNRPGDVRPGCTGRVVEGWEAMVVDDDEGSEVPHGEPGMLMVKGDSTCPFYWHDHELSKETIRGEWLRTGDTFVRDEEGYFYYRGRSDEMLKVGGMWVSPLEIESVLEEHERVLESAVVGIEDADGLTRPEAFVVLKEGGGEQQLEGVLRQFVRQRLGGNKTPRAFYFVRTLPRTDHRGRLLVSETHQRGADGDAAGEHLRSARFGGV